MTFSDSGQDLRYSSSYDQSWDVELGDVDGDGDLDAYVANYDQGNRLWFNDGSGTFTDSGQNLRYNNSSSYDQTYDVDLADPRRRRRSRRLPKPITAKIIRCG